MPIKKRKRPGKPKPRRAKVSPALLKHRRVCVNYYNRLQADDDGSIYDALQELCFSLGISDDVTINGCERLVEAILIRFDGEVSASQTDPNDNYRGYRCVLRYVDRAAEPKHGFLYPTLVVVKSSHRMSLAVTLAYVEICKNIGRFV